MGALTIAFDIIIVGALALPWVVLAIHLFYFEGENRVGSFLGWLKKQEQPAAVGILLFAMAYTLGSAVTRIAQDIFNDDDLYLQIDGQLIRWALTEDRILASVYCDSNDNHLLPANAGTPAIAAKISTFLAQTSTGGCDRNLKFRESHRYNKADENLIASARDIFGLQENALMDKGGDYTVRLRQLHDQVMVLRGAAFNGVVGLSLCLFAWGAALRREKAGSWLRLVVAPRGRTGAHALSCRGSDRSDSSLFGTHTLRSALDGIHFGSAGVGRGVVGLEAPIDADAGRRPREGVGVGTGSGHEMSLAEGAMGRASLTFRNSYGGCHSGMVVDGIALW